MEIGPVGSPRLSPAPARPAAWAAPAGPVDGFTPTASDPRERLEQVVDGLVDRGLGFFERRALLKAARGLGLANMEKLAAGGIRIHLLDPYLGDGPTPSLRAEYKPTLKRLELSPGRFSAETLRHELGHALDDLAEPDDAERSWLRSEKDPRLQQLYSAYQQQVSQAGWWSRHFGSAQWSDYATHNVHEYLAEGIMLYTGPQRQQRKLQASDPGLYAYLGNFLGG